MTETTEKKEEEKKPVLAGRQPVTDQEKAIANKYNAIVNPADAEAYLQEQCGLNEKGGPTPNRIVVVHAYAQGIKDAGGSQE